MVIGLIAAAGTSSPALMSAPALPGPVELELLGEPELPHAARMPPSSGMERPTMLPLRRKSRLDSRPATNSSMTCSWTGPRPLRRSSSRLWLTSAERLVSMGPLRITRWRQLHGVGYQRWIIRCTPVPQAPGVTHRAQRSLLTFHTLQGSQFVHRDMAAHKVPRFRLGQGRFLGLADAARQTAGAAGVENTPAGWVGRTGNLTGEN